LDQLDRYVEGLISDTAVCRDLNTDIEAILRDRKLAIRDEGSDGQAVA